MAEKAQCRAWDWILGYSKGDYRQEQAVEDSMRTVQDIKDYTRTEKDNKNKLRTINEQ